MMTNRLLIVLLFLLIGCQSQEKTPLEKADWLIGTWENQLPAATVYEQWWKSGENNLSARSFVVQQGDTLVFETIELNITESGIHYIPMISDQNNGQPVIFVATEFTEERMVFENPEHDFPQLIAYTKLPSDSLEARVYGLQQGQERDLYFRMRRVE